MGITDLVQPAVTSTEAGDVCVKGASGVIEQECPMQKQCGSSLYPQYSET